MDSTIPTKSWQILLMTIDTTTIVNSSLDKNVEWLHRDLEKHWDHREKLHLRNFHLLLLTILFSENQFYTRFL